MASADTRDLSGDKGALSAAPATRSAALGALHALLLVVGDVAAPQLLTRALELLTESNATLGAVTASTISLVISSAVTARDERTICRARRTHRPRLRSIGALSSLLAGSAVGGTRM